MIAAEPVNLWELLERKLANTAENPREALQFDSNGKVSNRDKWNLSVIKNLETYSNDITKIKIHKRDDGTTSAIKTLSKKGFFYNYKINKENTKIESITSCKKTEAGYSLCRTVNHALCKRREELDAKLKPISKTCQSPIGKQRWRDRVTLRQYQKKGYELAQKNLKEAFLLNKIPKSKTPESDALENYLSSVSFGLKAETYDDKQIQANFMTCAKVYADVLGDLTHNQSAIENLEDSNISNKNSSHSKTKIVLSMIHKARVDNEGYYYLPAADEFMRLTDICVPSESLEKPIIKNKSTSSKSSKVISQ